jgi:hypothetical protein
VGAVLALAFKLRKVHRYDSIVAGSQNEVMIETSLILVLIADERTL